ncbi:MAG: sugar phosphate isomerase/epimerase [Balneolales bacterium]
MNRRSFLKTTTAAVGGVVFTGQGCSSGSNSGRYINPIGLQLYSIRSLMAEDFEGTIERVAEIGYKEVEFARYFDRSPGEVRNLLERTGLTAPATHVSLDSVRNNLNQVIETAAEIGHQYVIVPSLPDEERGSVDSFKRIAEFFNRAGEQCQEAGIQLGYHNHAFEFNITDDQVPYDILLNNTDPELVAMELDLFWIKKGGYDPIEYFDRFPGRFHLCHVKDMDDSGNMVDVGEGDIDFSAIFAKSERAGLRHYIVEHDNPESPIQNITTSFKNLSSLKI